LYLTPSGLLALGLSPADEFWSAAPQMGTAQRAFSGDDLPFDMSQEKQALTVRWTREHARVL